MESKEAAPTPEYNFRAQVAKWREELAAQLDNSERHPRLQLTFAHPTGLVQLYSGRPTKLSSILREPIALGHGKSQLRAILRAAHEQGQKLGISAVQMAVGMVGWNDQEPIPVMLRPIAVEALEDDFLITVLPSIFTNSELITHLRDAGLKFRPAQVEQASFSKYGFTPAGGFQKLREVTEGVQLPGFEIQEDIIIGIFSNPLAPLLGEMKKVGDLEESELLRALAGQPSAREALSAPLPQLVETDPLPAEEGGIGDLTPADHQILASAKAGRSFLIETGPGVPSSPIAAALLAQQAVARKRVVYATTDLPSAYSLHENLRAQDLETFTINLCDPLRWKDQLTEKLSRALERALEFAQRGEAPDDAGQLQIQTELTQVRERLQNYTRRLHQPHEPWGVSAYSALQVLADLIGMRPAPVTKVRFDATTCTDIFQDGGEAARETLAEAVELGLFTSEKRVDPWNSAQITDSTQAKELVAAVKSASEEDLPAARLSMSTTASETGLHPAQTLREWFEQLQLLQNVREVLDKFLPVVFERSVADQIIATATKQWRHENGAPMKWRTRRRLKKTAQEMLRPGVSVPDLHEQLVMAQKQRVEWNKHCGAGGWPRLPSGIDRMQQQAEVLGAKAALLNQAFSEKYGDLLDLPISEFAALLERLAKAPAGAYSQPALGEIRERLRQQGLAEFVEDMQKRGVGAEMIVSELDLAWWASVLNQIMREDPEFAALDGSTLTALSTRFRELDRQHTQALAQKTRWELERAAAASVTHNYNSALKAQKMLHEGVRGAEVLTLFPWLWQLLPLRIASPLLASLLFGQQVDTLILDRLKNDSTGIYVPLVWRAGQLIAIEGPDQQHGETWENLQQFLPALKASPSRMQAHLPLAALMAKHGSRTSATPVPSPKASGSVNLVTVDGRGMPALGATAVESTIAEVEKVVDLVLDHAVTRPDQSLALCVANARHASHLREALLRAIAASATTDDFFRSDRAEPFVVIDPSKVQRIHRDRVILSLGFGKTPHGRMLHEFGPLSQPQGAATLGALLDVARDELTLVTSFTMDDIDPSRLTAPGEAMFSDLYRLAEGKQIQSSAGWQMQDRAPDRLLVDLAERLFRLGLEVVPNLGVEGGYRIPLAIGRADADRELLVAVLTDDDLYFSQPSLRISERHDIERLEASGWLVQRVYSTAVFVDPQSVAESLADLVDQAVQIREKNRLDANDSTASGSLIAVPADIQRWEEETVTGEVSEPEAPSVESTAASASAAVETAADTQGAALAQAELTLQGRSAMSNEFQEIETPALVSVHHRRDRGIRPSLTPGLPLSAYSDEQILEMLRWVASDQIPRTTLQYTRELHRALGLTRSGTQVDKVLGYVIRENAAELMLIDGGDYDNDRS